MSIVHFEIENNSYSPIQSVSYREIQIIGSNKAKHVIERKINDYLVKNGIAKKSSSDIFLDPLVISSCSII